MKGEGRMVVSSLMYKINSQLWIPFFHDVRDAFLPTFHHLSLSLCRRDLALVKK